jgi:SNF2 family DNA or RNA helicase
LVAAAVPGTAGPEGVVELAARARGGRRPVADAAEAPEGDRATDPAVEARSADDVAILARWASVPSRGPLAEAEPSPAFVGELRPYQRQGLAWLRSRRAERRGGALCDEMGLGKTVQLLAHVSSVDAGSAPTLVVAPTSLLGNWTREIRPLRPRLRVVVHAGPERARDVSGLDGASLVLTSYGTLLRDVDWLAGVRFDTVVLDEAQAIKNPRSKTARATRRLAASHRLALSGTPLEPPRELWSLVEFLNPGMLTWPAFRRVLRWRDAAGRAAGVELLLRLVRPLLLRAPRPRSPPSCRPGSSTESCWSRRPRSAPPTRPPRAFPAQGRARAGGSAGRSSFTAVTRLRQLACHPGLLDPRRTSEGSVKVDLLLDRLESLRGSGRKALVFSQFTALLELLRKRLEGSGHALAYLDGSTRDREEQVRRFQEEPTVGVFLISLKAGGTGLNLTAADDVFLLDPWWNPAVEAQAIDRAHRIGRTRPVMAWKLVVAGTIEERVLELQARKRALAESLFDPTLGGLTEAELLSLL